MDSKLTEDNFKEIVENYLKNRGYFPENIHVRKKIRQPDYRIINGSSIYLGELKAPELHLNKDTNLFMHLTKIRKLREFIKKSSSQFSGYDADHRIPWILFFTSTHFQFHGESLYEALRGYQVFNNGKISNDFRNDKIVSETEEFISKIDLFIWLQVNKNDRSAYQATFIENNRAKFNNEAKIIIKELSTIKISYMDRIYVLN